MSSHAADGAWQGYLVTHEILRREYLVVSVNARSDAEARMLAERKADRWSTAEYEPGDVVAADDPIPQAAWSVAPAGRPFSAEQLRRGVEDDLGPLADRECPNCLTGRFDVAGLCDSCGWASP